MAGDWRVSRSSIATAAGVFCACLLAACAARAPVSGTPATGSAGDGVREASPRAAASATTTDVPRAPVDRFLAARQIGGGDLAGHPALLAYVQRVGARVARAAGVPRGFALAIVDNSVPNAWGLPGGQVVVTRGLLQGLQCEAELAAVIAHELAHQLAHEPARERPHAQTGSPPEAPDGEPVALPRGVVGALRAGVRDNPYATTVVGEATDVASDVAMRFGSEDEIAADRAAMRALARAGYDPGVVADLQRVFLELAALDSGAWREGLLAHHPPSEARLQEAARAAPHPRRDGRACERYETATSRLRQLQPAYDAYDAGIAALRAGDLDAASAHARDALAIEPREAKFHELLGDVALARPSPLEASRYYDRAAALNPGYFKPALAAGIASFIAGQPDAAAGRLERSMVLLPTADASYWLGRVARERGDRKSAIDRYRLAATSDSDVGRAAARELLDLDAPLRADSAPPPLRR